MNKKILVIVNTDWFFLMHIFPIVYAQKDRNTEIYVLTKDSGKKHKIESYGLNFIDLPIDRKGYNPFVELKTILFIYKTYQRLKPSIVHLVTIKPIIYGSIFSRFFGIKTINTICGLGYSFIDSKKIIKSRIAYLGYRFALKAPKAFHFFENKEDRDFFVEKRVFKTDINNKVINGVGVDTLKFFPRSKNEFTDGKIVIILASRMLWEKGVKEFVEAAKLLFEKYKNQIEFKIYGRIDNGNPGAVPEEYLDSIYTPNYIKWYGFTDDMISVYRNSDIVVLPTFYKEGCPMVLMEACAMGRAIITTNIPGCKECVDEGVNGFKIQTKSIDELKTAMERLILDSELIQRMGNASRKLAEMKFDQSNIIAIYNELYK